MAIPMFRRRPRWVRAVTAAELKRGERVVVR